MSRNTFTVVTLEDLLSRDPGALVAYMYFHPATKQDATKEAVDKLASIVDGMIINCDGYRKDPHLVDAIVTLGMKRNDSVRVQSLLFDTLHGFSDAQKYGLSRVLLNHPDGRSGGNPDRFAGRVLGVLLHNENLNSRRNPERFWSTAPEIVEAITALAERHPSSSVVRELNGHVAEQVALALPKRQRQMESALTPYG